MHEKPNWFDIKRDSPEYVVQIRGQRHVFTYHNVKVCMFPEEFKAFNHIFYDQGERYTYLFDAQQAMDELHAFGFPMMYEPWPSEQDVEAFIQSEMQDVQ
jgi:hypothetical protein